MDKIAGFKTYTAAIIGGIITVVHIIKPDWIDEQMYLHLMALCGFGAAAGLRAAVTK